MQYKQVIASLGYDANEDRLDKYFSDKVKTITEFIKLAEALVQEETGRTFDAGSAKWTIYNFCVQQQAALLVIQAIRTYENNNATVDIKGAVRFDKTALGRQLSSVAQKLENNLKEKLSLLTRKVTPSFATVTRSAY